MQNFVKTVGSGQNQTLLYIDTSDDGDQSIECYVVVISRLSVGMAELKVGFTTIEDAYTMLDATDDYMTFEQIYAELSAKIG